MFIPTVFAAQTEGEDSPPVCVFSQFTLQSNVCVGDLIAIVACGVAGVGWLLWSIHAIRKMRNEFPFNYNPDNDVFEPTKLGDIPIPVGEGTTLTPRERVRARLMLTQPEEDIHQQTPILNQGGFGQESEAVFPALPLPPPAVGRSTRSSCRESRRIVRVPYFEGNDGRTRIQHQTSISRPGSSMVQNESHTRDKGFSGDYRRPSTRSMKRTSERVTYYGY